MGINDHFEKGLINSILLYGSLGTGKTMVSESIAAILDKNLVKIDNAICQTATVKKHAKISLLFTVYK